MFFFDKATSLATRVYEEDLKNECDIHFFLFNNIFFFLKKFSYKKDSKNILTDKYQQVYLKCFQYVHYINILKEKRKLKLSAGSVKFVVHFIFSSFFFQKFFFLFFIFL